VRALAFAFLVLGLQGALAVLLPAGLAPPDLFLLTALSLAARLPPLAGLGLGYGLGLVQDALGFGLFGLHAAGVAAGVYAAYGVRRLLSAETGLNHAAAVAAAEVVKWLAYTALGYWTRTSLVSGESWLLVFLPELAATLFLSPFVQALARWAFGPVTGGQERLL
jgi:rod shape-determining protein MreD